MLLPIILIAARGANYALSGAFPAGDKRNLSVEQRNQSSERRVHKINGVAVEAAAEC